MLCKRSSVDDRFFYCHVGFYKTSEKTLSKLSKDNERKCASEVVQFFSSVFFIVHMR